MRALALLLRAYLVWVWLHEGLPKLRDPRWMKGGSAVREFWQQAVVVPPPPTPPPIAFGWYRAWIRFLLEAEAYRWVARPLAVAQVAVGLALLLGVWTRLAALAGLLLNLSFALAGGRRHNPLMIAAESALVARGGESKRSKPGTGRQRH
jgi:thiosulfate dehydrogenase [quinone] large subunit